MSSQFVDEQTRQQYIIGITEILAQIFEIVDPIQKQTIYTELAALDDETLLEKQVSIEEYFKKNIKIHTNYFNQLTKIEHICVEDVEKSQVNSAFNF